MELFPLIGAIALMVYAGTVLLSNCKFMEKLLAGVNQSSNSTSPAYPFVAIMDDINSVEKVL